MFKRSLATCVAVAALSTATIVPAHAASVTVSGERCMITFAPADFVSGDQKRPYTREEAKDALPQHKADLEKFETTLERREALLAAGDKPDGTNEYDDLTISGLKARVTRSRAWVLALNYCADGKELTQLAADTNTALSSTDGKPNETGNALIISGSVLGVLGLVIGALVAMLPMLPPQVRDMLPPQVRGALHL